VSIVKTFVTIEMETTIDPAGRQTKGA